jgi:hypothetical protein
MIKFCLIIIDGCKIDSLAFNTSFHNKAYNESQRDYLTAVNDYLAKLNKSIKEELLNCILRGLA